MGVDQHGQHAKGLVVLDEAHTTHVGCEVVDLVHPFRGFLAAPQTPQIESAIVRGVVQLVPVFSWLDVDGSYVDLAFCEKIRYEGASDESAGTGNQNLLFTHP